MGEEQGASQFQGDRDAGLPMPTDFDWRNGSRTDAWRELWRRLLSDVLAEYARSMLTDEASDQHGDRDRDTRDPR